jgi:predicted MFS family arabinose efflux permease
MVSGTETRAGYALAVLFAINTMNFFDRQILGAVAEPVRREWGLGDGAMGALGTAFTLLYACVGVPLGRWVDRGPRTRILAGGVFVWSVLTALSGAARNFWSLFVVRLGVGVGEASCAPAASSLIGDLVPPQRRSRALSLFMMGLPVGLALSLGVSSIVAARWGWRAAFYIAGLPGVLCALAALRIADPPRGRNEAHAVGDLRRAGSPYLRVLSIPTMWWLILSGALHNFNMYAIGAFLSPLLTRFHRMTLVDAGLVAMCVYGLSGIPGLLLGGWGADALSRRRRDGRLLLGTAAILASVPPIVLALGRPAGDVFGFALLMGLGCGVMYVYYSTVYATLQDVIEPSLRGTAMALYFLAMYVLGASLGPWGTGMASDFFTRSAAEAAGVATFTAATLEPFRAEGLRRAMYAIPALGTLLTLVMFAASRTVTRDAEALQQWMEQAGGAPRLAPAASR